MCWTGTFSSSPETCLPINCSVRACQWVSGCVCARVRACILFVCVCLVFVMCRTRAFICALGARMHVVTWVRIQSFCLCVEVSSQTRGRAPSQMCPFLYLRCACAFSTRGVCVCVCVRLISLSVYSACIGTSACDLARWRGDWLVFMNKRHNCDRMIYDLHIPQSPPPPSFSLFLFAKNIYLWYES